MVGEKHMSIINSFGYAGRIFSNKEYNYTVVPKCASSIIIDTLKMTEGKNDNAKNNFTFIRHPHERLKSYLYQDKIYTKEDSLNKIKKILYNFDDFNEHCIPYSFYIKHSNFDFIGTLENFNNGFKKIITRKIIKESRREDNSDVESIHNQAIKKYNKEISEVYAGDFILHQKASK